MPSVGRINGTKLRLFVGTTAIGRATDCSVEFDKETETQSDKDSQGGWVDVVTGSKSGKAQCEMFIEEVAGGWKTLMAAFNADTVLTVKMTTGTVGDMVITGQAIVTSAQLKGTHKQLATGSISFTFTGEVTLGVVA